MSPTTSTPVLRISAVIAVTCLDSDPVGCTTLAASLSFISCSGLRCNCGELIIFSTWVPRSTLCRTLPLKTNACHPGALRKSDRPATVQGICFLVVTLFRSRTCRPREQKITLGVTWRPLSPSARRNRSASRKELCSGSPLRRVTRNADIEKQRGLGPELLRRSPPSLSSGPRLSRKRGLQTGRGLGPSPRPLRSDQEATKQPHCRGAIPRRYHANRIHIDNVQGRAAAWFLHRWSFLPCQRLRCARC